jgi:hypothetical protein
MLSFLWVWIYVCNNICNKFGGQTCENRLIKVNYTIVDVPLSRPSGDV